MYAATLTINNIEPRQVPRLPITWRPHIHRIAQSLSTTKGHEDFSSTKINYALTKKSHTIMTRSTSFLVLSDTHDKWPYTPEKQPPKVDVFLHCGDLTQVGGLSSFRRAAENIKTIEAELKIVIGGNHDLELDADWVCKNTGADDLEDELKDSRYCTDFMRGLKAHRIHYVEEGTHTFTLNSGKQFTLYASPYTPAFNGYAFAYSSEDRFNAEDVSATEVCASELPSRQIVADDFDPDDSRCTRMHNSSQNPIPAGVDIMMTHGPPRFPQDSKYRLDTNGRGDHLGCSKLGKAIQRVKPRLHCFGHIHEGRGAAIVSWDGTEGKMLGIEHQEERTLKIRKASGPKKETLLVNAAMNGKDNEGLRVEMEL
jgi:predicted phosphodiesterase